MQIYSLNTCTIKGEGGGEPTTWFHYSRLVYPEFVTQQIVLTCNGIDSTNSLSEPCYLTFVIQILMFYIFLAYYLKGRIFHSVMDMFKIYNSCRNFGENER